MRTSRVAWQLVAIMVLVSVSGCGGGGGDHAGGPTPTPLPSTPPPVVTPTAAPTPSAGPSPFVVVAGVADDTFCEVGFAGDRYLTTFSQPGTGDLRDVYGVRFAASGEVLDAEPLLLSDLDPSVSGLSGASYQGSSVAGADVGFGVFFMGSGTLTESVAPAQVIGFSSVPLSGAPVRPATLVDSQISFSMVQTAITGVTGATGSGQRFTGLYGRGTTAAFQPIFIGQVDGADVVAGGGTVAVDGTYVLGGGVVVDGVLHSAGNGTIASAGSTQLAVWFEAAIDTTRPAPPVVRTITLAGAQRTSAGTVPLSLVDIADEPGGTAVGSDGTSFLVAWSVATVSTNPPNEIRALRYRPADGGAPGAVDPPGGFLVADGPSAKTVIGVAHAAGTWLVAWLDEGILRGARIPADGTTVAPFTIFPDPVNAAALTSDGERFLVVVERPTEPSTDLVGLFVPATD